VNEKLQDYENSFNKMRQKLRDGKLDHLLIEIEVSTPPIDISNSGNIPPEMANVQKSILTVIAVIITRGKKGKRVFHLRIGQKEGIA